MKKTKLIYQQNGIVVDYEYNDEDLMAIVVEYTVEGKKYSITSSSYSNRPKRIGKTVIVKYNPENPKEAIWKVDSKGIALIGTGLLFGGIAVYIIYDATKLRNVEKQLWEEEQKELFGDND